MATEATKSGRFCRSCRTSDLVLRLRWEDDGGGPTIHHDDHVCLWCGRYVSQPGCSLCEESLESYRKEYGHVVYGHVDTVKRFLNMLWASLPEEWMTEALIGSGDDAFVEVRFVNTRDGREFAHKFSKASIAGNRGDIGEWARCRASAILREKGG